MLRKLLVITSSLVALWPASSQATEYALGRPITAEQISSDMGIVPPEPGWGVSISSINYNGDIGGSRQVPLGGKISSGIDASVSYNMANFTHIWDTGTGSWNFASAFGAPLEFVKIKASVATDNSGFGVSDSTSGIGDILLTPIIAGKHFSKTDHMSLSLSIFAPSASYSASNLANLGQNNWTFMPTIAYTHLYSDGGEFTAMGMLQLYTRNHATDYTNAPLLVTEAMWTTRVATGTNLGVVGGVIYQLGDDKGPIADRLNGFQGQAVGLGPIITWSGKFGGTPASLSARWVTDVEARNRPKGNSLGLSVSLLFL
ncbi:SphA family protein [Glaciimonas soli]|uniref:Transporter n=1 Tax=Glaciimonas soli TaxID=2590999 RepID=A0A843YTR5_9BURK|nr:transporter [Glaciimonas soli]MQR01003.1 transporter [Glaciimonas soli]